MLKALASGLVGAIVLNLVHETVRQFSERAPRVDLLGQQAVAETYRYFGAEPPAKNELYAMALAGDLASNATYYSLVAAGGAKNAVLTGAVLGAAAGVGAVYLPKKVGLRSRYTAKTPERAAHNRLLHAWRRRRWHCLRFNRGKGLLKKPVFDNFRRETYNHHSVLRMWRNW